MTKNDSRQRARRALLGGAARAALVAAAAAMPLMAAAQQAWPAKPVTMVVPFAPGGTTDVVARLLGQKLGEIWGQTVVIDNRAGAGGNIGATLVSKAGPDGYTLLMASGSILTVNPHLYRKLPFNAEKDFVAITNVAAGPMVAVVPASMDVKSVKDLIALAKKEPHKLNFGSAGVGSQVHMAGENFVAAAGVDMVHVPYKGEGPSYTDLMAGQLQLVVGNMGAVSGLVGDGRLRAIAVTSKQRSPLMPDVPTVAETIPGFENVGWFGLLAPTGTPKDVVEKVYRDTAKVLAQSDVKGRLYVLGMTPVGNRPDEFVAAIAEESKHWAKVITERKLVAD